MVEMVSFSELFWMLGGFYVYWGFNEGEGNVILGVIDEEVLLFFGMIYGKVDWVEGKVGKVICFDVSNFVDLGDVVNFD